MTAHYDASLMIDQLAVAKDRECVAYGIETQQTLNLIVFPLLLGEIRKRGLTVVISHDRITNNQGGYLLLFAMRDPNWEMHLRGRHIVAGNVPDRYMKLYG